MTRPSEQPGARNPRHRGDPLTLREKLGRTDRERISARLLEEGEERGLVGPVDDLRLSEDKPGPTKRHVFSEIPRSRRRSPFLVSARSGAFTPVGSTRWMTGGGGSQRCQKSRHPQSRSEEPRLSRAWAVTRGRRPPLR